jgi:hypothetical protein
MMETEEIARSPAWFPLERLSPDTLRLLKLDEAAYQRASFLDQRLLAQGYPQVSCSVQRLTVAASALAPRGNYIFHIGHVGSTLIARLLGARPSCLALREPALLRAIAMASPGPVASDLDLALRLFSRTWRPEQRALIKVTSFANELARPILSGGQRELPRALVLFAQPLAYLRTILAGPNSRREAQQLAGGRLQRLTQRIGPSQPAPRTEGEHIAMSWLCEMVTLQQALQDASGRVRWIDFDRFLTADPAGSLEQIGRTLQQPMTYAEAAALVSGHLMRQYSKAPEHAYDAALRRTVLASADHEHGAELRRGMEWLAAAASRHASAAMALEAAATPDATH